MSEEIWVLAPMKEPHYGNYWVSNKGRVKNRKGRILKGGFNTKGYPHVCVKIDGSQFTYKIHRLVATAFLPNPNNLPQVNHIDGNKTNNDVNNLEWCDNSYNHKHKCEHGLNVSLKGEQHGNSKLTEEAVKDIYTSTGSRKEVAQKYEISIATVSAIRNKRLWSWFTDTLDNKGDDYNE